MTGGATCQRRSDGPCASQTFRITTRVSTRHSSAGVARLQTTHNDVVVRMLDDLWDKSDRYRRIGLVLPPGDEPRTRDLNEHRQMMELVIRGDGEGAAELMRNHIRLSLTASAIEVLEAR